MTERAAALDKLAFTAHPYTYDTRALQPDLGHKEYSAQRSLYRAIARSV
jgi:hypothetical protein